MGRPLRTRIDFAKTLSWYDFFHNQLIAFGKIKNDFGLAKLLCKDTENSHESNLFKKYKFGLSTPQQEWIDIIDFLKTYDNSFSSGYRFGPSEILVRIKTDAELETKLDALKKHTEKTKHQEILDKVLKKLSDDTFIELENEITNQYKVLASFKYLEQLILTINIPEEVSNEIPE